MHRTHRLSAPLRRLLPSLLASVALLSVTGGAEAGSVVDSIRSALAVNPDLGVVRADRRAVDQELRQARARLLPTLDLRAAAGPEWSHNDETRSLDGNDSKTLFRSEAQLTLTQLLFDGFETRSEIERQKARVDSAARRVRETSEFVALDAVQAHLEVLRRQAIVELNEANVAEHERILAKVRRLEREGRTDIADVRQTEARLAQAKENLAIARGQLQDAIADYRRIVGQEPVNLLLDSPPEDALPASAEEAAALASTANPTVLIAAADVDAAEAELRAARAGFYPRLDLELSGNVGNAVLGDTDENGAASALVVMRYNFFRGGADIAREREAFHRVNEARARLLQARFDAEQQARRSYNALETARARRAALAEKAEAQRRTRDAYESQFDIGQRNLLDLLDAENELFLARVNLRTAEFTERFAVYRVLATVGQLLATLDVAPPREHLDIHRTPETAPTPEAIEEKSRELVNPRMEPRPLRGEAAGEPPAEDMDAAPHVGRPPAEPVGAPEASAAARYDSFASFWAALTGGAAAPAAGGEATAALAPAEAQTQPAARVDATPAGVGEDGGPARYEDFGSFWKTVFGGGS